MWSAAPHTKAKGSAATRQAGKGKMHLEDDLAKGGRHLGVVSIPIHRNNGIYATANCKSNFTSARFAKRTVLPAMRQTLKVKKELN